MANVHDVAAYIIDKCGDMTAMKLQKLAYYSQAWSLVWEDRNLFDAEIQAWANGPVMPELYHIHRGQFSITQWPKGNPGNIKSSDSETIDSVLEYYGDKSSQWLSDLTHHERPWIEARKGLSPGERSDEVISNSAMAEYYSALAN